MTKLDDLKNRIIAAKGRPSPPKQNESMHSQANLGIQILTELIASILVGVLLGYWLDRLFHTEPVLFIGFIFLGIITGLINAFRVSYGLRPLADPGRLQRRKNKSKDESGSKEGE